jgi:hypothetical protein
MPIFKRLKYAMYILIAVTMVFVLALSIGEGVGFIRGLNVERLMFHPLYVLPVFIIGFALAPALSERMPISGDQSNPSSSAKARFGYTVRTLALVALGLALALFAALVVFLFGKFS